MLRIASAENRKTATGFQILKRGRRSVPQILSGAQAPRLIKANALSNEQITELYRAGFLGLIHAHLISLGNVVKLEQQLRERE